MRDFSGFGAPDKGSRAAAAAAAAAAAVAAVDADVAAVVVGERGSLSPPTRRR